MKKKFNGTKSYKNPQQEVTHLQTRLTAAMPKLMEKVTETKDGQFVFVHEAFPDLRVEGITFSFVEEHVERAVRRHFRGQSDKHVDYLFNLLLK